MITDHDLPGALSGLDLIDRLAFHFADAWGAPSLEAALPVAAEEIDHMIALCEDHPDNTLMLVERSLDDMGIREKFRLIPPKGAFYAWVDANLGKGPQRRSGSIEGVDARNRSVESHVFRNASIDSIRCMCREKSTCSPAPTAPPAMPVPAPRGTSGILCRAAASTRATTSAVPVG